MFLKSKNMKLKHFVTVVFLSFALNGCMAPKHNADVSKSGNLTVGTVQKEIKKGMSGAEVAATLGSPNIVTTDAEMRETWVYDKITTEVTRSESQKTLTVIIKFDEQSKVREFAYHTSRF